ncbi:MAG: outer membrane protein assembly factor BamA [Bacteroidetes bacterium]|nr:outer membrane protein assembly factor BamA [Bacteroidota bacterium]
MTLKRIQKIFFVLLLVTAGFVPRTSAQDDVPTYRIVNISVKGNRVYDSKTIIAYSGLRENMELSIPSDETRESIKRLWKLGLFSNIALTVDKKFGRDVYLVISVDELPRIEGVEIIGNDHFSTSEVKEKIGLENGEVVSEQKLKDVEYNLEQFYAEDGYALASVKVDKLISANNEARIRLKIDEGKKLTVREISFEGNTDIPSKKLKGAMDNISEKVWWKFWDGARFEKTKFEDDKKLIVEYYHEKGYKDAEVVDSDMKLSPDKEDVFLKIKVREGRQFKIDTLFFEGNKIYPDSLLYSRLGMKKGEVYNMKKFQQNLYGNETENDLAALYYDNGYLGFNADVVETPVGIDRVSIKVKISENNQYRLGLVNFEGNDKTQDKVLRREMYTIPGEYFNRANVKRSIQQLNALNYFNPEKLNQDISLFNDSTVNIKYLVQERSSDQFNASVGYSGSFGFTGALGLTFNNFDVTHPFTGGGGQALNFSWQFGEAGTYRTFNIGLTEPWFLDTPTLLGFNLFDTRTYYTYDVRETGAQINIGRRFKWPDDFFRGDWSVKFQNTDVVNGGGYYQEGNRTQFSLRQTITRSSVFDPIFPLTGTRVALTTELSGGPFLPGNTDFVKNIFSAETYTPLFRNSRVVLYSDFNFYIVNSIGSDRYLPPTELFYMGGNGLAYNTIALRGYDDRAIGPKYSLTGSSLGGKVALKYGVELRYPLSLDPIPIFILGFAEAGNVWSEFSKVDPFDLRRSAGFGVRLQLPAVGMIGFDLGYGFDSKAVDNTSPKFLFHFQFGRGF